MHSLTLVGNFFFQVSLTIDTSNKKTVSPGDTVTFKGKATPGSLMAFRAVDKSVLLMKEDTDLSLTKVICYIPVIFSSVYID